MNWIIRHDTIPYDKLYLCAFKSGRVVSLIRRTEPTQKQTRLMKKTKKQNRDAQKKRCSHKVRRVSPKAEWWQIFVKEILFRARKR